MEGLFGFLQGGYIPKLALLVGPMTHSILQEQTQLKLSYSWPCVS